MPHVSARDLLRSANNSGSSGGGGGGGGLPALGGRITSNNLVDGDIDVVDDDCFGATDEVKVYKDEGDEDDEKPENLSEEKFGLIETEECKSSDIDGRNLSGDENSNGVHVTSVKERNYLIPDHFPFGYPLLPPYPYPNGPTPGKIFAAAHPAAVAAAAGFGFYMYGGGGGVGNSAAMGHGAVGAGGGGGCTGAAEIHSSSSVIVGGVGTASCPPPPAHMGIQHLFIDSKTGLPRHPMYALPPSPGRVPPPLYGADLSHVPSCFDLLTRTAVGGPSMVNGVGPPSPFRHHPHHHIGCPPSGSYSPTVSPSGVPAFGGRPSLAWFPGPPPPPMPPLLAAAYGKSMSPPASSSHLDSSPDSADSLDGCRRPMSYRHDDGVAPALSRTIRPSMSSDGGGALCLQTSSERRKEYIKKPLNAFMLFMKECRQRVIEECTLKESAAINQILGRKWHALGRAEQAKYYEMARKEKELHMQTHPGWSARDNYATHTKKKKKAHHQTHHQNHHSQQQQQHQHVQPHHQHHAHKKIRDSRGNVNSHHEARLLQLTPKLSPASRIKDETDRLRSRGQSPPGSFNHSLHSSRFKHSRRGMFGSGPVEDVIDATGSAGSSENRTPVIEDSRGTFVGHFGGCRGTLAVDAALPPMSRSPIRSASSSPRSRSGSPRGREAVVDYRRPPGTSSVVDL